MNLPSPSLQGFIYSMGTSEDLKCVKGVSYFNLINEHGKEINACYAAMVSTESFLIPYKLHVSKYIIAEVNAGRNDAGDQYYELDQDWKEELQSVKLLPASLPKYQIGMDSYWPAIGLGLLFVGWIVFVIVQAANSQVESKNASSDDQASEK